MLERLVGWTDPLGRSFSQTWAGNGRLASRTEPGGRTWEYEYDAAGNEFEVFDPMGAMTRTIRNVAGQPTRIVSPEGRETEFEYDALGRQTGTWDAASGQRTSTWITVNDCPTCQGDALGLLATETDGDGRATTTSYDALGRVTAVDRPLDLDESTTYDSNGRPASETFPGGVTSAYTWNSMGLLTTETRTGPNQPVTNTHTYDALRRRTRTVEPLGVGTTWELGLDDDVTTLTVDSPAWAKTYYDKNGFGEMTKVDNPDLSYTMMSWDAAGRETHRWDASGRHQWFTYNTAGDLTAVSASGGGAPAETATYTYDATGRRLMSASAGTTVSLTYDDDGLVASRAESVPPVTQTYTRDTGGRVTLTSGPASLQSFYGSGPTRRGWMLGTGALLGVTSVDDAGRDAIVWNPPTIQDAMNFMMGPPPTDLDDVPPLGRALGQTYTAGRLTGQELRHAGTTLHTRTYGYTPDSRVNAITDSLVGTWAYGYDDIGRVTGGTHVLGGQTTAISYTYDAKGNRTAETTNGATTTYAYNVGNRDGDRLLSSTNAGGTTTYTYDGMGRPVLKAAPGNQMTAYSWDAWGRLRQVMLSTGTSVTYAYDTWGDRVAKHVTQGGTTTSTYYWRDESLFYETNAAGVPLAITGFAEDGHTPLWRQVSGTAYVYHTDHLGTPILMTDLAGAVVWAAVYEPFGAANVIVNTVSQPWRFPGQYYDTETGLHYNRQRYYDPLFGRYLTPDPIGQSGGFNTYVYAANSGLRYTDPTGECPLCLFLLLAALLPEPGCKKEPDNTPPPPPPPPKKSKCRNEDESSDDCITRCGLECACVRSSPGCDLCKNACDLCCG